MDAQTTVFVPTCGHRSSLGRCLAALGAQSSPCNVDVINGVAPMSAAFNAMMERCVTPTFVQCDDDMILKPDAVVRLLEDLLAQPPAVALLAMPLWDVHLGRPIVGCKIYRTDAVREAGGWRDVQSCEVSQLHVLAELGYSVVTRWHSPWNVGVDWQRDHPLIIGDHDPEYTPEQAYERYRDLTLKNRRMHNAAWVEELPALFVRRIDSSARPSQVDIASLEGCRAGLVASLEETDHEKDFSRRPWHDEYVAVAERLGLEIDP